MSRNHVINGEVRRTLSAWAQSSRPAVLFDFNGTLSNDEPDLLYEVFGTVFREQLGWNMTQAYYRKHFAGLSDTEIITGAVQRHGAGTAEQVQDLKRLRAVLYKKRAGEETLIDRDTVALVGRLASRGVPMGIVTGAQRDEVMAVLAMTSIGNSFDVIVTDEDVRQGKPNPEGYLLAAKRLETSADCLLVFEDSVVGVNAALAAGMRCVAVGGASPSEDLRRITPCVIPRLTATLLDGCRQFDGHETIGTP